MEEIKLDKEFIFIINNVMGLLLGMCGSFLPWGKRLYLPVLFIGSEPWKTDYVLGIELTLGQYAFAGAVITAVSLVIFWIWKKRFAMFFVLAGGLTTLLCSLLWILNPGFSETLSAIKFTASYGVYVSFMGGLIALSGSVLGFVLRRKGSS